MGRRNSNNQARYHRVSGRSASVSRGTGGRRRGATGQANAPPPPEVGAGAGAGAVDGADAPGQAASKDVEQNLRMAF